MTPHRFRAELRETVRQFTPNWFTVTMGTGILSLALSQFPVPLPGLHALGEALWWLNMGLFVLFAALYATRWAVFPHEARRIFGHSVVSMFFGAIPMGLATIINGFLAFGIPHWGRRRHRRGAVVDQHDHGGRLRRADSIPDVHAAEP